MGPVNGNCLLPSSVAQEDARNYLGVCSALATCSMVTEFAVSQCTEWESGRSAGCAKPRAPSIIMGLVVADLDLCGAKTSQGRSARRRRCSYQGFGGGLPAKAVSPSWTLDSPAAGRVSSERVESAWVWLQHGDVMYHLVQSRSYSYFVERCADTRRRVVLQLLRCRA